jgi:hypothetical protein
MEGMLRQGIVAEVGIPVLRCARGHNYDLATRFCQFGDREAAGNGVSTKLFRNVCVHTG